MIILKLLDAPWTTYPPPMYNVWLFGKWNAPLVWVHHFPCSKILTSLDFASSILRSFQVQLNKARLTDRLRKRECSFVFFQSYFLLIWNLHMRFFLLWVVAWSTTQASMGFGVTSENHPSVTPRFVALVLLILKLRLSLPSLPRAMRWMTKTTLGFGLALGWPFFGWELFGKPPRCRALLQSPQRADSETAFRIPTKLT